MSKTKRLSGDENIKILMRFGFSVHSQRGSHVKLRRINTGGGKETLTIPRHREIDSGTILVITKLSRCIRMQPLPRRYFGRRLCDERR